MRSGQHPNRPYIYRGALQYSTAGFPRPVSYLIGRPTSIYANGPYHDCVVAMVGGSANVKRDI